MDAGGARWCTASGTPSLAVIDDVLCNSYGGHQKGVLPGTPEMVALGFAVEQTIQKAASEAGGPGAFFDLRYAQDGSEMLRPATMIGKETRHRNNVEKLSHVKSRSQRGVSHSQ